VVTSGWAVLFGFTEVKLRTSLFDRPALYRHFHHFLSREKCRYLQRYLTDRNSSVPLRVLDLGCGPGTSCFLFSDKSKYEYLGLDINEKYIRWARQFYNLNFRCADVTKLAESGSAYDLILINSVMHHLSDLEANRVLSAAQDLLSSRGECVVLDMIRPETPSASNSVQRMLIRLDRGSFCRELGELQHLLASYFETDIAYAFVISFAGVPLWDLRLFVCRNHRQQERLEHDPP
jgi:SAM-dependent methyltransferase